MMNPVTPTSTMSSDIAGSEIASTPSNDTVDTVEELNHSQQESDHDVALRRRVEEEEADMASEPNGSSHGSEKSLRQQDSPLILEERSSSSPPLLVQGQGHAQGIESDQVQPCESHDSLPLVVAPSISDDTIGMLLVPPSTIQEVPPPLHHFEIEHPHDNSKSDQAKVDGEEKSEKATKEEHVSEGPEITEESARINQQQQQQQQQQTLAQRPRLQQQQQHHHQQHHQQQQTNTPPRPSAASSASTEIVHSLFGPSVGHCWGDFSCQYNRVRGRLYASTEAVLFYSNIFGFEKRISLRYDNVQQMQLYRATSIQISVVQQQQQQHPKTTTNPNSNNDENDDDENNDNLPTVHYIFKGFAERAQTLQLLIDLWKHSQGPENIEAPEEETEGDIRISAEQELLRQQSEPELHAASQSADPLVMEEGTVATATTSQKANNTGPHNPPSILRPSKISTPPSRPVSPARIDTTTTTPTRLFPDLASSSSDRGRRSKSLPPLHRRRDTTRSQSLGRKSETTSNNRTTTDIRDTFDWEKEPSQSDLDAWNVVKGRVDPAIKLVGIKVCIML
jgi:hypothetical protein